MGCSGGKHRATSRQMMGCSRDGGRGGRWTAGVDPRCRQGSGPAQASMAPDRITPGSCHTLAHAPCPLFWLFVMWTITGGTEKLLNMRVQGSPPAPSTATRPVLACALEARCCGQTGHLPLQGGFQPGTRKENSKWSLP